MYYRWHDPEAVGTWTNWWNLNTLTYDLQWPDQYDQTWAFVLDPSSTVVNKWFSMVQSVGDVSNDYAWTVWVR